MSSLHPLRGKIQTVEGLIDPEHLGPTLMHEHVLADLTPPALASRGGPEVEITLENVWEIHYHWVRHLGNSRLDQEGVAVQELKRLHEAGGRSLVELTCSGMKRNPPGLRRVARGSGVRIIMGCGTYTEEFLPLEDRRKSVEALAQEMETDLLEGAEGTGIRAGIIGEIGCSHPLTDQESRGVRAAVLAQQKAGACINIHPGRHPAAPFDIVRRIQQAGGDPSRVIISHIDRTIFDLPTLLRLAETGCVLEFDFFGLESSHYPFQEIDLPNDGIRLRTLRSLIDEGHLPSLLISHDICTKTRLVRYGGHGYGHILSNILPLMRRKGFKDSEIDTLLVRNPRRLLTFA